MPVYLRGRIIVGVHGGHAGPVHVDALPAILPVVRLCGRVHDDKHTDGEHGVPRDPRHEQRPRTGGVVVCTRRGAVPLRSAFLSGCVDLCVRVFNVGRVRLSLLCLYMCLGLCLPV